MKRTANYDLPTWEQDDAIRMKDFNDLTGKLDAALKSGADANTSASAALTALLADVGSGGHNCRAIAGSYTGAGTYGAANKITLQTDFTPLLVLITNPGESANLHLLVWLRSMTAGDNGYSGRTVALEWGEHSVAWYSTVSGVNGPEYLHLNAAGYTYQYVILGY